MSDCKNGLVQLLRTVVSPAQNGLYSRGGGGGGGTAIYGHIGMCRCEGYGFQAVNSSIGYINQSVWV